MRYWLAALLVFAATIGWAQGQQVYVSQGSLNLIDSLSARRLVAALDTFLLYKDASAAYNPKVRKEDLVPAEPFVWLANLETYLRQDGIRVGPQLLAVVPRGNGYMLKLAYNGQDTVQNKPALAALFTLLAEPGNGTYTLRSPFADHVRQWQRTTLGSITYHHSYSLNPGRARAMDSANIALARKFGVPVIPIQYYLFQNPEELFKALGYDYLPNMYYAATGGLAEPQSRTLFAANNSELYIHDLVHFYTRATAPQIHRLLDEGYATWLGGSDDLSFPQLVVLLREYMQKHPGTTYASLTTAYRERLPGGVPVAYVIAALVCRDIETRLGFARLQKMFQDNKGGALPALLERNGVVKQRGFDGYVKALMNK